MYIHIRVMSSSIFQKASLFVSISLIKNEKKDTLFKSIYRLKTYLLRSFCRLSLERLYEVCVRNRYLNSLNKCFKKFETMLCFRKLCLHWHWNSSKLNKRSAFLWLFIKHFVCQLVCILKGDFIYDLTKNRSTQWSLGT